MHLARAAAHALLVLCLCLILAACTRAEHYATRGVVRAVEGGADDRRIAIHHERIEAFKDREGKAAPMHSMVMVFGLHASLAATPPAPGTKVSLEFDVRWDERPILLITRLARLPDSTDLTLSTEAH